MITVAMPSDTYRVAFEGTQLFADVHSKLGKCTFYHSKQYQLPFTWNGPVSDYNKEGEAQKQRR